MLTLKSYPEEGEKVAHSTISPWHHQNCYRADLIWEYFNVRHPFRQGDFCEAPLE